MIYTYQHLTADKTYEVDVCIIGSGAGGSAAAMSLVEAGLKVLCLEAGSFFKPSDFTQREENMFPKLFYDSGNRFNTDLSIRVLHGHGVGGSTLHNINLCKRLPKEIVSEWDLKGFDEKILNPLFERVETDLTVSQISSEEINMNNQIMQRGVEKLGYKGGILSHNRKGCMQSGFCELGCSFDAKMNAMKVYLKNSVKKGLDIFANTKALRFEVENKKINTLMAEVVHPHIQNKLATLKIKAKHFVLSAGAIESPLLLQRSNIPDPHGLIGTRLHLHPGSAICGVFDEKVNFWEGIPQSYECTEFLDFSEKNKRTWLITGSAHPIGVASLMPGFGSNHSELMSLYPHLAAVTPMIHDETSGSVNTRLGKTAISYKLIKKDQDQFRIGLVESAKILFAAGAKYILWPNTKLIKITDVDELLKMDLNQLIHLKDLVAVHPMSSLWMGNSSEDSVTDTKGRYHHLDNLYVADTSLYPTSIGIPPQITTYTVGHYVAQNLLQAK